MAIAPYINIEVFFFVSFFISSVVFVFFQSSRKVGSISSMASSSFFCMSGEDCF